MTSATEAPNSDVLRRDAGPAERPGRAPGGPSKTERHNTKNLRSLARAQARSYPAWFLIPAFAILAVFFFVPTILNFVYAFTNWSAFHPGVAFIGWDNFVSLFSDGQVLVSLRTTLIYALLVAVFQNLFGFVLALFLEKDTRLNRTARVFFFIPVLMSSLAVGYIFQAILQPDGALNGFLGLFAGHSVSIPWLGSTTWTIVVVALVQSWKFMGLSMLIYLAGFKTMSEDVLEAAKIDGASWLRTLRSIRFPLLAPALTFNVATALLGSMNGFDVVQGTTKGGPAQTTEVLNIFIYRTFGQGLYAQATTMSLILFLVVIIIAFPVIKFLRKREEVL
ncbi:carbohydrate ABC transporter membrane protein 1 (CUT1 family) [Frondihabitans sp. PhB188]|uniref:carbohydrate ABC transporter permease n=1 Tax=Frondihabitans sp. PhB188 TaxID=2485200 RepID=UPI000F92E8F2|nr:sugar ABC transporter permease [Frondihabitans sp. PhB188]ROQ41623.1 carbohydrate ABC transporter membrane protein 1 (CUT1 family) [Frondihabitans sp. PhB188]